MRIATALVGVLACTLSVAQDPEREGEKNPPAASESADRSTSAESLTVPALTRRLTEDGLFKSDPVFRRMEEGVHELVYSVQQDSVLMVLTRLDLATGVTERLHPKSRHPEFRPTFAGDGVSYAYLQSRGNQNITLCHRESAEKGEKHLEGTARHAALDAAGKVLYFTQPGDGGQQIIALEIESGTRRKIAVAPAFNNWPVVSPDGKQLAFSSGREDNDLEVWVVGVDGEGLRRITRSPGRDIRPAWSLDGKRLAFVSARDGEHDIWIVDLEGGAPPRNVTRHPERDDFPVWHPDGKHLVFVGEREGRFDLHEIAVEP